MRHASSTVAIAAIANRRSSTSARSSTRSAPEMIVRGWSKRAISSAIAQPSEISVASGTTRSRTNSALINPSSSTTSEPIVSATSGDRLAQSMWGPVMRVAAASSVMARARS